MNYKKLNVNVTLSKKILHDSFCVVKSHQLKESRKMKIRNKEFLLKSKMVWY